MLFTWAKCYERHLVVMLEVYPHEKNQFIRRGARIFFIGLVSMLLAICAMVISVNYQYPEHPSCRGMLGAGFPVLYICDDWGGGSPTSSWGKITPVDVLNEGINLEGFLVDFLFYTTLFYTAILLMRAIHQRMVATRSGM